MPEIEKEKLNAMLADVPAEKRDAFLADFKKRGYTIKGAGTPRSFPVDKPTSAFGQPPAANERGLIDEGPPMLAPAFAAAGSLNEGLRNAGQKLEDVKGPAALAAYPAGMATKAAGSILPENFGQGALMYAMGGPVGEGVGAAAGKVWDKVGAPLVKAGGNMLADVVGELAGKDPESVKALYNNPKAMWQKATEIFGRKDQEKTIQAVESDFAAKGEQFRAIEDSLSGNFGTPSYGKATQVITRPAFDDVKFQMAKEGFRLPGEIAEGITPVKIGKIADDAPEYKFLVKQMVELKNNPRLAFGDAVRMKQNLDKAIDYGLEGANGLQPVSEDASRLLRSMRKALNKEVRTSLDPERRVVWDKVNAEYGAAAQSRAELRKQVMGQNARLTEKKLHQLLKEGRYDDEVMDRAKDLGAKASARLDAVRDHIAARQFKSWGHAPSASGFLPTSPKAIGYGVSAAGGASQAAQALARSVQNAPLVVHGLIAHALTRDQKDAQP